MKASLPLAYLLVVSLTSASALAYEVLLMRLFSIVQWHHFAYMIISLALLGYGISGVFIALNRHRLKRHFPTVIVTNLLLFAIAMPACFLLAQKVPFNPAEILWDPRQLLYLFAIYLVLTLPFFFAANVIGLSFYQYKENVSFLYAADLLGAGIGSVGIILLLFGLFPEKILTVLLLLVVLAALTVSTYAFDRQQLNKTKWNSAFLVIAVIAILFLPSLTTLQISPYKSQSQLLTMPETKIIDRQSSPLGLITVVESNKLPLRHAPGLSITADTEPPEQLAVFTDGDNMSAITAFDGDPETVSYLDQMTSALPYHLHSLSDVLILGAGTGSDVLQARFHNIKQIDVVEMNAQTINLVQDQYSELSGHIYSSPEVNIHITEARGYVSTNDKNYDLVSIPLMDSFGSVAGLHSMAENYLYTEQAIRQYLQRLNPDGFLSFTRWIKLPPRDMPKLLAMVINVLKKDNIAKPAQQLIVIRSWQTSTLLVKNGSITTDEINRIKQFCQDRNFDLVYYPGITEQEVNQFNILQQPFLYQAATQLLGKQQNEFIDAYKFNITPATDDRPYFSQFFKWQTLPEIISLLDSGGLFLLESGYLLLIAALTQAIVASFILIVLPLWLWKNKLGIQTDTQNYKQVLVYFFCLGLAFLFIEIAFIQKFILILHHPLYAITTVLCAFLLAAGAGSYFSKRLSHYADKIIIMLPVAMISLLSIIYSMNFEEISSLLLSQNDIARYLGSVLLIVPLGFFMGMPFPLALDKLSQTMPELIPWAWGINGCASVISAILATLIAMQFGFNVLIMLAVVLYLIAAYHFPTSKL